MGPPQANSEVPTSATVPLGKRYLWSVMLRWWTTRVGISLDTCGYEKLASPAEVPWGSCNLSCEGENLLAVLPGVTWRARVWPGLGGKPRCLAEGLEWSGKRGQETRALISALPFLNPLTLSKRAAYPAEFRSSPLWGGEKKRCPATSRVPVRIMWENWRGSHEGPCLDGAS